MKPLKLIVAGFETQLFQKQKPLTKTSGEQLKTRSLRWLHWERKRNEI